MPARGPPGVTMTLPPSTSGDSLISQGICRPPKSARMLRCHLIGAVGEGEAREVAALGEDVHPVAVDRRRPARPRPAIVVAAASNRSPPDDPAVGAVQARDGAGALGRVQRLDEDAIALHGNRSVAGAQSRNRPRRPAVPMAATAGGGRFPSTGRCDRAPATAASRSPSPPPALWRDRSDRRRLGCARSTVNPSTDTIVHSFIAQSPPGPRSTKASRICVVTASTRDTRIQVPMGEF